MPERFAVFPLSLKSNSPMSLKADLLLSAPRLCFARSAERAGYASRFFSKIVVAAYACWLVVVPFRVKSVSADWLCLFSVNRALIFFCSDGIQRICVFNAVSLWFCFSCLAILCHWTGLDSLHSPASRVYARSSSVWFVLVCGCAALRFCEILFATLSCLLMSSALPVFLFFCPVLSKRTVALHSFTMCFSIQPSFSWYSLLASCRWLFHPSPSGYM